MSSFQTSFVNTSPPVLLICLSSYFQGMFLKTARYTYNNYVINMCVDQSVNKLSNCLSYLH